tara:strand:- start:702 stop:1157 length:456 start_codon:yes stop_codon:yes gene_type:complete
MGTTRFSGPIKAGNIPDTYQDSDGNTITQNVGFVVMGQSAVIDIIGADATTTVAQIPANSQIVDVILNVTTVANDSGTAVVNVGTAADPNAFLSGVSVEALATTHGTLDTEATDVGSSDISVIASYDGQNGDGTTGAATVTVLYLQNNNLS